MPAFKMAERNLKDIIQIFKKTYGMKVIVKDYGENSARLIVMKRGDLDNHKDLLMSQGIKILEYDAQGRIKRISFRGIKVSILSHKECG